MGSCQAEAEPKAWGTRSAITTQLGCWVAGSAGESTAILPRDMCWRGSGRGSKMRAEEGRAVPLIE
jgi:hypothetical protein